MWLWTTKSTSVVTVLPQNVMTTINPNCKSHSRRLVYLTYKKTGKYARKKCILRMFALYDWRFRLKRLCQYYFLSRLSLSNAFPFAFQLSAFASQWICLLYRYLFFYIKGIELFIAWYFVSVRCPHESTSFSYTWFMIEWKTSFTDFCSVIWEKTSRFVLFFFLHIGKLIPQIES